MGTVSDGNKSIGVIGERSVGTQVVADTRHGGTIESVLVIEWGNIMVTKRVRKERFDRRSVRGQGDRRGDGGLSRGIEL